MGNVNFIVLWGVFVLVGVFVVYLGLDIVIGGLFMFGWME